VKKRRRSKAPKSKTNFGSYQHLTAKPRVLSDADYEKLLSDPSVQFVGGKFKR
jgi:hypothetical protein